MDPGEDPWFGAGAGRAHMLTGQLDPFFDANEIMDGVWLGGATAAETIGELHIRNIGYVLNVTEDEPNHHEGQIKYLNIKLADSESSNLLEHFKEVCAFINEALSKGKAVLVHCAGGVSRSTTCLCAFLMQRFRKGRDEMLQEIRERRWVQPNNGFMDQLRHWELHLQMERFLVRNETLD